MFLASGRKLASRRSLEIFLIIAMTWLCAIASFPSHTCLSELLFSSEALVPKVTAARCERLRRASGCTCRNTSHMSFPNSLVQGWESFLSHRTDFDFTQPVGAAVQ